MNKLFQGLVNYAFPQVLVFGIVAGMIYYFTAYNDGSVLKAEIADLDAQIAAEEAKKKDTEANLKEEARMKESISLLGQQYLEVTKRLPTSLSSIDINRHIDTFARNSGVSIKARRPAQNIRREIVEEVPVSIQIEGSYSEIAGFLFLVASSQRATSMKSFSLSPIETRGGRLRLDGTVVGYQLSEPSQNPKGGAK